MRPLAGVVIGFSVMALLIGMYNYHKTKDFYIIPSEGKYAIHTYFSTDIIAKKLNLSSEEAVTYELEKTIEWAIKNDINFKINKI